LTSSVVLSCQSGFITVATPWIAHETVSELTELSDLNRILLHLARSREFPEWLVRHGYDFIAPLMSKAYRSVLWKKYRDYCRVRRFWDWRKTTRGRSVSSTSLAARTPRAGSFDYSNSEDDDDEAGCRFEAHAFWPGEYVSISGQGRKLHAFRVVTVDPVVLSMALINRSNCKSRCEGSMIKDVMVRLDGGSGDDARLAPPNTDR